MFSTNEIGVKGLYGIENRQTDPFPADYILKWNGDKWLRIGQLPYNTALTARCPFFTFDFGDGPELVFSASFREVSGVKARAMARWNGRRWLGMPAPDGIPAGAYGSGCDSICVWDDGIHGRSLYVGFGSSTAAPMGSLARQAIRRWNGTGWESVGGGLTIPNPDYVSGVQAMAVFDDGTGPALFVAGHFQFAGGIPATNIAKWNGQTWTPIPLGIGSGTTNMVVANDGRGESLFLSGVFNVAGGQVRALAQYVGCRVGNCYADCDNSHHLNANDFLCFMDAFTTKDPYANCDQSSAAPAINAADFQCYLNRFAQGCP